MFENYSIWDKLRETDKPIFLYGTGNGGDKIINALEARGGRLTGVFASDGFVRDRHFRGYKVRSYSDVVDEYGDDIIVLLAFGTTLPSVRKFIEFLDSKHELIIPDVPLYGGDVFDYEYFSSRMSELNSARELLCDDRSKAIFDDAVNFRLTGKLKYLLNICSFSDALLEFWNEGEINSVLDGGAFKGDTSADFAETLLPKNIYAVEADPRTYKKLCDYADSETRSFVTPINAALWDADVEIEYVSSASRGSGESGANKRAKVTTIPALTIDSILKEKTVDIIKLDIEGAEHMALDGALTTLAHSSPNMIVSLYHRTDDLFSLIKKIHKLLPTHKLYLRRVDCIPLWDLNLYAVKTK
ncbi:MAG: FkbM family methyltransferase [Ruminococcaceae bacterium]|nr:FkbM family methyltransferase [Oscillospiraceae bacterium]